MKTVSRYSHCGLAKKFVAPGRAVSAHNVYLALGPSDRNRQVMQQIKEALVQAMNFAGTVVPQELV
jgi:hypothetical protein